MNQPFEHVVIIGCGLLGASLGLALRKDKLARLVTGVGRHGSTSVAVARQRGAIDRATDDAATAVRGAALPGETHAAPAADLVVVCTPVRQFPEMFRTLAPALQPGTIVTDVGSTKADVMDWAAEILPSHVQFIGAHPMAGSEKNGPEAAREDLYKNGACLICVPSRKDGAGGDKTAGISQAQAHERTASMWRAVGMRIIDCSARQHDDWVAAVSHLPHAIASSLVTTAAHDPASLETAAGGFIDTSRIASGDVTMWTDIFMTNRAAVARVIEEFTRELTALKQAVETGDEADLRERLLAAKRVRDEFMAKRRALAAPLPPAVPARQDR